MATLKAYKDNILCIEGDFGDKVTESGLIIKSTIGSDEGITPRWFKAFEVGPDIDWVKPGQWLYVAYGRWTEGFTVKDDRLELKDVEKLISLLRETFSPLKLAKSAFQNIISPA